MVHPENELSTGSQETTVTSTTPAAREKIGTEEDVSKFDFGFLLIPVWCRFNPQKPFHFGLTLTFAFGLTSTFVVANLYYCQPLLVQFSDAFQVSYQEISKVPTLVQAGYATGLLLISPLGDLVRRRALILVLIVLSTSLSIGLALTSSFPVFLALNFLIGLVSVTPQVLIPLAADIAPPERRGSAIAVTFGGLIFGVLMARVLAGVIGDLARYQVVYYFAIGVQTAVLFAGYWVIPDYPRKNKDLGYFDILWSMAKYAVTEPLLIQACLTSLLSSACFSSFWVTLTFLLSDEPYNYSTLIIGLFGLIGMLGVALSPLVGRFVDHLTPWYATLLGTLGQIVAYAIQVGTGGINVGAVVVVILLVDVFRQSFQVSQSAAIFGISEKARARLNAVYILFIFIGQVMGTAVGTKVFLENGWRASAGLHLGWMGLVLVLLLCRGPQCDYRTWVGYKGGLYPIRRRKES